MKKKLLIGALAVLAMLLPAKMKAQLLTTSKGTTLWGNVVYCQSWADDTELKMSQWPMGIYNFTPVAPSITRKRVTQKHFALRAFSINCSWIINQLRPLRCRPLASVHVSTGQCTCFHWPVYVFPLATGPTHYSMASIWQGKNCPILLSFFLPSCCP